MSPRSEDLYRAHRLPDHFGTGRDLAPGVEIVIRVPEEDRHILALLARRKKLSTEEFINQRVKSMFRWSIRYQLWRMLFNRWRGRLDE